jgi:hypothetical protein
VPNAVLSDLISVAPTSSSPLSVSAAIMYSSDVPSMHNPVIICRGNSNNNGRSDNSGCNCRLLASTGSDSG